MRKSEQTGNSFVGRLSIKADVLFGRTNQNAPVAPRNEITLADIDDSAQCRFRMVK